MSEPQPASQLTLVIVDDHPLFRGAMRQALSTGGDDLSSTDVEILEAGDLMALQTLLTECAEIDLVLLDLAMPGVSGFSGLLTLRAEYSATPVVIVSATEDPTTIRRALDLDRQIAALNERINGLEAQISSAESQIATLDDEIEVKERLLERKLTNRSEYLRFKRNKAELEGRLGGYRSSIGEAKSSIVGAKQRKSRLQGSVPKRLRPLLTRFASGWPIWRSSARPQEMFLSASL